MNSRVLKAGIREEVWRMMEERGVASFPVPVRGRIPNFKGAERAAALLAADPEFEEARVVKVNPDSPQLAVRKEVLRSGKTLVMPTPRLRGGFLLIDSRTVPRRELERAATIRGAFVYGKPVHPSELPEVDLIVLGSVAVTEDGWRVGKGEGYAELEYAILRTFGKVEEGVKVYTTVHELQITDFVPVEPFDVAVDAIFTDRRVIRCPQRRKPDRIYWELLEEEKLSEIPLLRELRRRSFG
ncbi:MAG: 5-formyltetrahydrofolate cyclo-ligase [Thaumarchaeota archaeon]|nr:5-formyltetrahydrofolate cyclo-ligase [Candidatus Calditenuaceae archaeon]MDW8187198.1 5-formyltetrahydrofolate cyclo-ligase [Nitrososphaerota archaeon]